MAWPGQQTGVDSLSKSNGALDLPEQSTVYQKLLSAKATSAGWFKRVHSHVSIVSQMYKIMNASQLKGKKSPGKKVETCSDVLLATCHLH